MAYRVIYACALLAIAAIGASAQSASPVEVSLALGDGKTTYRAGELITLVMTFNAFAEGYSVREGRDIQDTIMDEVMVTPSAGVVEWKKQYMRGARYTSDAIGLHPLDKGPVQVAIPLNDFVRFESAGHYTVRIKTKRIWIERSKPMMAVTTNDVSFDIRMMSASEEAAEAARLGAALDKATGWEDQTRLMTQLSYLTGAAAIPEKIKRFLTPIESGNYNEAALVGLYISKDRARIIKLLEDVFRDVSRPVNFQLLGVLSSLRFQQEVPLPAEPVEHDFYSTKIDPEAERIKSAYLKELVDSLPKRQGKNLNEAAYVILQNLPGEDPPPEWVATVRKILIEHFDELTFYGHEWLLQAKWELFRDPVMIPSLEKMLTNPAYPDWVRMSMHSIALKRLTELSPSRARPFLVAKIKDPTSMFQDDTVESFHSAPLPEVDIDLVGQIRNYGTLHDGKIENGWQLRFRCMLAAKFATNAVYDQLLNIYKTSSPKWPSDARAFLLSYISRHDAPQALLLLDDEFRTLDKGQVSSFLHDMTKFYYAPELTSVLEQRLASDDARAATSGAYILSLHGPASSRSKIEARLKRWLARWGNREFELDGVQAVPGSEGQSMLQTELVSALLNGKNWKLTDSEKKALAAGCINRPCLRYFPEELLP